MGTARHTHQTETDRALLRLSAAGNAWSLTDKTSGFSWGNEDTGESWFCLASKQDIECKRTPLFLKSVREESDGALWCRFADGEGREMGLTLVFRLRDDMLQAYYLPDEGVVFPAVELFTAGLQVTGASGGECLVPVRMGLLIPAAGKGPFARQYGTYNYEGAHMAMTGIMNAHAAAMACWTDPYTAVNVIRTGSGPNATLRIGFSLTHTANAIQVRCLGETGMPALGRAYRERAVQLGYRVPWNEKRKTRPQVTHLFGASNVKLWSALARKINLDLVEEWVSVGWTFDEAARVAEHLKHDLGLDRILFHMGGWINYGYDCRHPDIMPAAPELGGNAGLADCARRVKDCGYLFCLHDNYQDMYRDAESWNEDYIQKTPDGALHLGNEWLGGQAYLICAREALKLARRPQNLELVREVCGPDIYFIDTTFAATPQECFDPRHPLDKQDDIHWKQTLSEYVREVFGMMGSECGREWAVPCGDFFEGITSVYGEYLHNSDPADVGGNMVPFFDMVYRDCVAAYGKYGTKPELMAEQVIFHAAIGRTLYYQGFGRHLYWEDTERAGYGELPRPADGDDKAVFTRAHNGWGEGMCLWDRYMKNTHEMLGPLNELTSETLVADHVFVDEERRIRKTTFENGATVVVNGGEKNHEVASHNWRTVVLPRYGVLIECAEFAAFHALSWDGRQYDEPALFTLRSLDGLPLKESRRVRVFHGFGDSKLAWDGGIVEVKREDVLERSTS